MNANQLQGTNVSPTPPTLNQILAFDGTAWTPTNNTSASAWSLTGNAGTNPSTNYLGTSGAQDLVFRTNAVERMRMLSTGNIGVGVVSGSPGAALEVGTEVTPTPFIISRFNNANLGGSLISRRARGTFASPVGVTGGDILGGFFGSGWTGTAWSNPTVAYGLYAQQTFTGSAQGTYATVETTPNNATTRSEKMRVTGSGNVGIANTSPESTLVVGNGSVDAINTPRNIEVSIRARSESNLPTTPQQNLQLGWVEGAQDLGEGEGTKISFTGSLVGSGVNSEVATISSYKNSPIDTTTVSDLRFATAETHNATPIDRMTITSSGRVGINQMNPGAMLDIQTSDINTRGINIQQQTGQTAGLLAFLSDTGSVMSLFNATGRFLSTNGTAAQPGLSFFSNGSTGIFQVGNELGFSTNGTEAMRMLPDNKVGIGTALPRTELHISSGTAIHPSFDSALPSTSILSSSASIKGLTVLVSGNAQTARGLNRFIRSRGTTSAPTAVVADDFVGDLLFGAHDGTSVENSAGVFSFVDGPVSTGTVPLRLSFVTGNSGGTRTENLTVKASGNVGVGTTTPNSTFVVNGSMQNKVDTVASALTLNVTHNTVLGNATSGAFTITLPACTTTIIGRRYMIMKTDASGNAVTVGRSGSDTINGATTNVLSTQYSKNTYVCGSVGNWFIF